MRDTIAPIEGLALTSLDFSSLMTQARNAFHKSKKVIRVGAQALFMKSHYYQCQPLDAEKFKLPNDAEEKIGFNKIALVTNVLTGIGIAVTNVIGVIVNLAPQIGIHTFAAAAMPLSAIAPFFGVLSILNSSYQTYQELNTSDDIVPKKAKCLSVAILVMTVVMTALSVAALFVAAMNPYTLPVVVVLLVACIVCAYFKHQSIMEANPEQLDDQSTLEEIVEEYS